VPGGGADLRRLRRSAENRLGEEGGGYRIALSGLAEGRISIAAACVGIARSALEQAARYLGERRAFGAPLAEQQGLRFMVAEMARDVEAARALTRRRRRRRTGASRSARRRRSRSGRPPTRR
jgi:alkylation response protein AidB-like acyl-CoA dehydrogenase